MVKVCKFIVLIRKVNRDPVEMATSYLFKQMQSEEFSREIEYLKSPSSFNETPKLVSRLRIATTPVNDFSEKYFPPKKVFDLGG